MLPVATAKLPQAYERAKDALLKCSTIDECAEWKNKAEAIASYARQADDETLLHTAQRIKARAIRRCGELLKAIEPAKGGDRGNAATGGRLPVGETRKSVATSAGLSKDQQKQALRVASIPEREFERAVESPRPPTVTELAKQGTKQAPSRASTAHLYGRDPKDFEASTRAQGALRAFVNVASEIEPATAVRGAVPHELSRMAANARAGAAWIAKVVRELERSKR